MFRYTLLIVTFLSIFSSVLWGADKTAVFTQKDFASLILQQFSWSDGLPKESSDRDYLMILGGKRTYRYEAENAYNALTDRVSIKEYPLFGPFTGKGWINGISEATSSTMTILLPIGGEYDLKTVIKGDGFVWKINDKEYRSDSKSKNFQETDVATKLKLKAGIVTIKLTIPANGAIDSFSLSAPDYTSVQPFMGWRFKEKLTALRMAEIAVAMTDRFDQLPDAPQASSPKPLSAIEKAILPPTAAATTAPYLGGFASPKWVRADFRGATLQMPFSVAETGYYGLKVRVMGETVSGSVNSTPFKSSGKQYLDMMNIGVYRLEAGDNQFSITLPPMGGMDEVQFTRKNTTSDAFMRKRLPGY
jgi:hypothetical protein